MKGELLTASLEPSCGRGTEYYCCVSEEYTPEQPTANSCSLTNQVLGFKPSSQVPFGSPDGGRGEAFAQV